MSDNLLHFTDEAASRKLHPTVTDLVYDDETPDEDEDDEGFADLDATIDQLVNATDQLHKSIAEYTRTPKTDHMLLIAAVSTGFAIGTLFSLLLAIAGVAGARP